MERRYGQQTGRSPLYEGAWAGKRYRRMAVQEYGGPEHTNLFIVRAGSPEEMELPWPKVQRRIAQLIKEDRFLQRQNGIIWTI